MRKHVSISFRDHVANGQLKHNYVMTAVLVVIVIMNFAILISFIITLVVLLPFLFVLLMLVSPSLDTCAVCIKFK